MINIDSLEDKVLAITDKSKQNSDVILIAAVTKCLASHDECTGHYIDFTHKYRIICSCDCHKENDNAERRKTEKGK